MLVPDSVHLSTNSLTYVFDRDTLTNTGIASVTNFHFETAAGQLCNGATVLGGNGTTTITVSFNPACGATVGQAVRAGEQNDQAFGGTPAVFATQDIATPFFSPTEYTVMPNCASPCATSRPDLTSATLGSNNDQIVFTFDKNVIVNPAFQTHFFAELENGNTEAATGATLTGPNQVTATFSGNLANKAEFAVEAWADFGTVFAVRQHHGQRPGPARDREHRR